MTLPLRRLVLLALLPLALAGCRPRASSTTSLPASGELDAFEDGNMESSAGTTWTAIFEGGEGVNASVGVAPDGFHSKGYHLVVSGFKPPDTPAALMGARAALAAQEGGVEAGVDVAGSGFTKLALAVKGTPGTYVVQLGVDQPGGQTLPYNAYVEAGTEWTEFIVPLADFKYDSGPAVQPWAGGAVRYVAVYAAGSGDLTFEFDDVRFVK